MDSLLLVMDYAQQLDRKETVVEVEVGFGLHVFGVARFRAKGLDLPWVRHSGVLLSYCSLQNLNTMPGMQATLTSASVKCCRDGC